MPKSRTLGARLAQERRRKAYEEERDIDRTMIAEAVGTTHSSISRYEADVTKPDDEMLGKLAAYFGVTRSWLRFGEGERLPPSSTEIELPRPERPRARGAASGGSRRPRQK